MLRKGATAIQKRARQLIQRGFFHNEWLQGIVWRMYYTPNRKRPSVPLSAKAQKHLAELRENGITLIPGYLQTAAYVENTYFSVIDGRESSPLVQILDLGARELVTNTVTGKISFTDEGLNPLFFDEDLAGVLYNYYCRQPFYRENPFVIQNKMTANVDHHSISKLEVSAKFHVDYYRQISCILLVNDLTENDTHLEYAIGSHKKRHPWGRYKYSDANVESEYEIMHAVGKRGTLVVMDAGSGLHRGVHKAGTVRKVLHVNVTTGHYFSNDPMIEVADLPGLAGRPDHIRRLFDHLVA